METRRFARGALALGVGLAMSLSSKSAAIDVPDPAPEYLQQTFRPQWRLVELRNALQQIGEVIEKPVALSPGIEGIDEPIILLEDTKSTVREIIELVEHTHRLHCTAEPLRLVFETEFEHRQKQRRLVNLNLRDYGLFFNPADFKRSPINAYEADGPSDGAFSDDGEDDETIDIRELFDALNIPVEDTATRVNSAGNIMMLLTPGEEAQMRSELDRIYELRSLTSTWRVHYGTLPHPVQTESGLLPTAQLRAVIDALRDHVVLETSALNGQWVQASRGGADAHVFDVEVNQTGRIAIINPVVESQGIGYSVLLSPTAGIASTLLVFDAEWTERVADATAQRRLRVPAAVYPATSISAKDAKGVVSESAWPLMMDPGRTILLEHAARWSWTPSGDVFVPRDHGLVLTASRGDDRLAIVFEEVKP